MNIIHMKKDGKEDEQAVEKKYRWDEENRLLASDENGFVANYWYDADGERTVKSSGEGEQVYVNCRASREQSQACLSFAKAQPTIICDNSEFSGGVTNTAKFSLYVSPYLVASQGGKYTKHIYIGSQRIVSKLGDLASYGADPRRIPYAGTEADGVSVDYQTKYNLQQQAIKDNYAEFGVPYNGEDNNDYINGEGFCCNDGTPTVARAKAARSIEGNLTELNLGGTRQSSSKLALPSLAQGFKPNDDYEKMQFYYHPDHLGSSSYITNLDGEVVQHIEYVPFGEVFIEERNNTWNTPYLFNAKEYDEETGMYYYGARYYEPRMSLWMSTDPLEKNFPSYNPYVFSHNNPLSWIDNKGMADYFSTNGKFIRSDNNEKDPYIYIQTRKGNIKLSDYQFENNKSGLRKMMRIVFHYGLQGNAPKGVSFGVDSSKPEGIDASTLAYTRNDKNIRILVENGKFDEALSQIYNMKSTISHEIFHTTIKGKSREEEIVVILKEMKSTVFRKTTSSFRQGTAGYLQDELENLYRENLRLYEKYIDEASKLLRENGANGFPQFINGENEIVF